jgi:hypothetical protein
MTDSRTAYDEQLPWLEEVDDEDGPRGVSARRMLAALAVVLVAALVVSGTFYWLGQRNAAAGAPELIRAEPGPYKVRPENPGGLDVGGESATAYQTSAGEDPDGRLDVERVPEPPAVQPEPAQPAPNATPEPVRDDPERTPAPSGAPGSVVQLGAFANRGQAERAWSALSSRFSSVAAMDKMIVPFSGGIRLRAAASSPSQARDVCEALKAAGEACFIAN